MSIFSRKLMIPCELGIVVTFWPIEGVREDRIVCDLSRKSEGLFGVRRRRYCLKKKGTRPPDYPSHIEYLTMWELHSLILNVPSRRTVESWD